MDTVTTPLMIQVSILLLVGYIALVGSTVLILRLTNTKIGIFVFGLGMIAFCLITTIWIY